MSAPSCQVWPPISEVSSAPDVPGLLCDVPRLLLSVSMLLSGVLWLFPSKIGPWGPEGQGSLQKAAPYRGVAPLEAELGLCQAASWAQD